jgi:dCTP deaminase
MGLCIGKSTYARCGILVNVTPLQPEWEGSLIIEISNTTPLPAKIYAGEGIAEILFFKSETDVERSYAELSGAYSHQTSIVLPKV